MFVVLWKGGSYWGEWDHAFYELQHPDNIKSVNLRVFWVFFKPLKNLKVETVKHLLLSAWFLLPLWQCWSSRVGNSQRSWNSPWCILSGWCQQATPKGRSCTSDATFDEGMKVCFCDRRVSNICASVMSLFLCVKEKALSLSPRW